MVEGEAAWVVPDSSAAPHGVLQQTLQKRQLRL